MQPRSLRPSFVVTFGALSAMGLSACPKSGSGTGEASSGEPGVMTSDDPSDSHVRTHEGSVDFDKYPNSVNAKDGDGNTIYRGPNSCYVKLPFDEPPSSWRPSPTETVPCPPVMQSAHWSHCVGGTLRSAADGSACLCLMDGNPPPPPHLQDCPL